MKKYKISKFSQHMGISIDTIKHYQECGILKPIIDSSNNYRYYNITHGERLIVSRKFRNIGFNIQDTADMISCLDGLEIKDKLFDRQKELEQLKLHYDSVKYLASLSDNFNNEAGSFVECTCPGYYFFRHTFETEFIEEDMISNSSLSKMCKFCWLFFSSKQNFF